MERSQSACIQESKRWIIDHGIEVQDIRASNTHCCLTIPIRSRKR